MRGSSRLRGGESCLCSPVHSSWNVSCQPSSAVGSHRTGSRTGILNDYSCGLQGGWWRLISCDSAASMLGCSQAGPRPRRSCPQLQSQHPSRLATYQQGKSIVLNVLPIVARAAGGKGRVFLLLLRRVRKEDRVCWRLCSSRRLREESLCVSSCLVVRKLALPPVPCVRTEPRHAHICPGEPGEAMPTQVRGVVSKPHVLLQELITPLSLCSRKKNVRQVNCPYTNLLAKFSLGGAHILAYWRVF